MNEITTYIAGKIVDHLPSFILSRLFSPRSIAAQVEIRLRSENPISLALGAEVPRIDLCFEISNFSYLNLVLDRLLIDLWFGQPTFQGVVLKRYSISARKSVRDIYHSHSLTSAQKSQIEQFINNPTGHGQIHIYLIAYFVSKTGVIEVVENIERSNI
jgi:hypothetical protein